MTHKVHIWHLGVLQKGLFLVCHIFHKLFQTCKDLMTTPYYLRNIWISDLQCYLRLLIHVMQKAKCLFLTAQLQISKAKSLQCLETIPPFIFIYAAAVELSSLKTT